MIRPMTPPLFQHRQFVYLATLAYTLSLTDEQRELFATWLQGTNPAYDRTRWLAAARGQPLTRRDKP
jgi:hypothetical protein